MNLRNDRSTVAQPFPIGSLAKSQVVPEGLPTPPDSWNQDPMEWEASKPDLTVPKPFRQLAPASVPQPRAGFRGHLPADVVSPAHRLRNPPNQPTFRKAPESAKFGCRTPPHDISSVRSAYEDQSPSRSDFSTFSPPTFKDPSFFPTNLQGTSETGLESILQNAFSIGGEPEEVRQQRIVKQNLQATQQRGNCQRDYISSLSGTLLNLLLLALAYSILYITPPPALSRILSSFSPRQIQYFALSLPAIITLYSFTRAYTFSSIFAFALPGTIAVAVLFAVITGRLQLEAQAAEAFGRGCFVLLAILEIAKRAWMYGLRQDGRHRNSVPAQGVSQ